MAFDPVTVAATAITNVVIKTVWDEGRGFIGWVGGGLTEAKKELIFRASRKYVENYSERHGILKVLGMREPLKLETVYTSVQFLGQDGIRQFESIENLELAYREAQRRKFQAEKCEKRDGLKVANEKQFLMVLGAPGAGKSTFLRRMGLEALKGRRGNYKPECVPVFVELKRFITGEVNLEAVIIDELETCGFPSAKESVRKLLEKGKLLILLDGLDEVPTTQLDKAIGQIQDFVDRHKKNRFIASCRTAAYRSSFQRFTDVVMSDFDDEQIEQYITNWFQSENDQEIGTAKRCWELLQSAEYAATKELAQTPLLLALLCLVFDDSQTFPKNQAVLYGDALNVLLKRWAAEKRIQRDPIYQDLTVKLEEMMLAEIAYTNFSADRLFFSERDVAEQVRVFLSSNVNAPQHLDSEKILEAIQIQQGILVERARDVLSFSHLTLQEYLTAQYIADNDTKDNLLIKQLVQEHLTDQRWRVVLILVAGLVRGGADELLLQMEAKANRFIATHKLRALIDWSEQQTRNSEGDYKPAAKRASLLYLATGIGMANYLVSVLELGLADALDLDTNLAMDVVSELFLGLKFRDPAFLDVSPDCGFDRDEINFMAMRDIIRRLAHAIKIAYKLALDIEELGISSTVDFTALDRLEALMTEVPSEGASYEYCRAFADQVLHIWYDALHLKSDWIDLSDSEIESLRHYLRANRLIIRCKEAALRVSPQVWEGIESRMLTVRE